MKKYRFLNIWYALIFFQLLHSQNLIKSNQLKKVLPSNDKVMTTEIISIPNTNYFLTTGDNKSKLWDLGSEKMLAEISNPDEKRTSLTLTSFFHVKQKLFFQLSVTNFNVFSFPDLKLVYNKPTRSIGSDILFNQQWDYFFQIVDDSLHKISLHDFKIIESYNLNYSVEELGYFSDSSALFYKVRNNNKRYGIASINAPQKITWSEIDYDIEEFITENFFMVTDKKKKKTSGNDKEYFIYNKSKNKLLILDTLKTAPENEAYSKLTGTYFYNDSYYKSKSCVNVFSIKKELTEKYICLNSDSVKNKINKILVDEELKLVWILDEYQLHAYDLYTYEKKHELKIKARDFYLVGNGLVFINKDETISFIRNLKENNMELEKLNSNFMSQIYRVNHLKDGKLVAITEDGVSMIDLKTLYVNTLHKPKNSNLKFSDRINFEILEGRYASRKNELIYFSDDSIYNFKFKSIYYDKQKEELYYLQDKLIKKVNIYDSIKNSVLVDKLELHDSILKQIDLIQFHPDSEFIYYTRFSIKLDKLNSKNFKRYQDDFSSQFKLIKMSLKNKKESIIELPNNIKDFDQLKFGYFKIIKSQNQSNKKNIVTGLDSEIEEYNPIYNEFIYKVDNEKLINIDSIIELSRYSSFKSERLLDQEFIFYQNDTGIFKYEISTKKLDQIIKMPVDFKKNNNSYDKFYFDYKNNIILFYGFTGNNIIYDLTSSKIISFFKAHQWQQNSAGCIDKNSFYTSNDQEISFWDKSLKNVFKIILHKNGGIYIHDTLEYYYALKGVVKDLHFTDKKLNIVDFNQIDPFCNRPDIILSGLTDFLHLEKSELIDVMANASKKRLHKLGLENLISKNVFFSFPEVKIKNQNEINYEIKQNVLKLEILAKDSVYNLKSFNVSINEVPIFGSIGKSIAGKKHFFDTTVYIHLSSGKNKIQISVINEIGLSNFKYPTYVNYKPLIEKEIFSRTHFIGIGVDHFTDTTHNLNYCVKDIEDLADAFKDEKVKPKLLKDKDVSKQNILKLKQYLRDSTTVNDRVIISCSSHGLLDDSLNFYLATHDVDFKHPEKRGIPYEVLESLMDSIPARQKLLLLDACNSGENDKTELLKKELKETEKKNDDKELIAYNGKAKAKGLIIQLEEENVNKFRKINELFVNVRNNTGSVIISAAGGQQSALEAIIVDRKKIENGAFTYSILECMKQNQGKKLNVNTLKQYAEQRVEEITGGKQKPTSRQETMEVDWGVR